MLFSMTLPMDPRLLLAMSVCGIVLGGGLMVTAMIEYRRVKTLRADRHVQRIIEEAERLAAGGETPSHPQ